MATAVEAPSSPRALYPLDPVPSSRRNLEFQSGSGSDGSESTAPSAMSSTVSLTDSPNSSHCSVYNANSASLLPALPTKELTVMREAENAEDETDPQAAHVSKPSISCSSVYSLDREGGHQSWRCSGQHLGFQPPQQSAEIYQAIGTNEEFGEPENYPPQEDCLETPPKPRSQSSSSIGSSPGRPELWRRRSEKSDRSITLTELKLAQSNGFTANQPLRKPSSRAPAVPLPPVPQHSFDKFVFPPREEQITYQDQPRRLDTLSPRSQTTPDLKSAGNASTHSLQRGQNTVPLPRIPAAYQINENSFSSTPLEEVIGVPHVMSLNLETMGEQQSKLESEESEQKTINSGSDKSGSRFKNFRKKFQSSDENSVTPSHSDDKGSSSAFSKLKSKLGRSDADEPSAPPTPTDFAGRKFKSFKNRFRSSSSAAEDSAPGTPTEPVPVPTICNSHEQDVYIQEVKEEGTEGVKPVSPLTPIVDQTTPGPTMDSTKFSPSATIRPNTHQMRRIDYPRNFSGPTPRSNSRTGQPSSPRNFSAPLPQHAQATKAENEADENHIHPLLRRKTSAISSNATITVTSSPPLKSPRPRHAELPPVLSRKDSAPGSPALSPRMQPEVLECSTAMPSPRLGPPLSGTSYKLQVPGEMSKRMSTILESSPFLQTGYKRGQTTPMDGAQSRRLSEPDTKIYPGPMLDITQLQCYHNHRVMRPSRNDVYSVACSVCAKEDKGRRYSCAWCAVRCCQECLHKIRVTEGGLSAALVNAGRGNTIVEIMGSLQGPRGNPLQSQNDSTGRNHQFEDAKTPVVVIEGIDPNEGTPAEGQA